MHASPDCVMMLLGNKTDLPEHRQVLRGEAEECAIQNNIIFFEVSAKSGENIDEAFVTLAKALEAKAFATNMEPEKKKL